MAQFYEEPPKSPALSGQSTEKSIKSCYAVVYELENRKWVVSGEGGWSEVHLCEDSMDNSHRILAWTVKSQQVLMNCNVTLECNYKEKSKNFHSFSDENSNRYGLGFHKSESGLKQATHFLKSVVSVITQCKNEELEYNNNAQQPPPPMSQQSTTGFPDEYQQQEQPGGGGGGGGMPPPNPYEQDDNDNEHNNNDYNNDNNVQQQQQQNGNDDQYKSQSQKQEIMAEEQKESTFQFQETYQQHQQLQQSPEPYSPGDVTASAPHSPNGARNDFQPTYHLKKEQHKSLPAQPIGPLGHLKILPPKQQKHFGGDAKIKNPTAVEHTMKVTHDKETGLYSGLPAEWLEHLNKQFGVKPTLLNSVKLDLYEHKIPKVIITLRNALQESNGYQQVGIFRLAPNASDNKSVKEKIDKGQLNTSTDKVDVNVYANLLKVWFRDLPDPLLNCVNPDLIEHVSNQEDAVNVINTLPEPNKSIFLWLCDMCVDIAKYEKTNKMSAQNMAIVVGPNLFNTDKFENPMKAMTYSGKVVEFFKHAILWRKSILSQ